MNSKQRRRIERQWKYTVTWTAPPDDNYDDDDYPIEGWPPVIWLNDKVGVGNWCEKILDDPVWDEYLFQFKHEKDALMFSLRWL